MPKKRQLITSNNCFELGKVGLLRYSNEKHALGFRNKSQSISEEMLKIG